MFASSSISLCQIKFIQINFCIFWTLLAFATAASMTAQEEEIRVCQTCEQTVPASGFSAKQWKRRDGKCKTCVAEGEWIDVGSYCAAPRAATARLVCPLQHIDLNARVSLLPDAMRDIRGHIRSMLLSLRWAV